MKTIYAPTLLILCILLYQTIWAQQLKVHEQPYQLQRSDVLDLKYRYTPEFDQTVNIGPDGQAVILGMGSIDAAGMTLEQFRTRLLALSSARLVNPDVSVLLKDYVKPHVFVEGEVNTPGRVELRGTVSALDAIALAGGFKTSGSPAEVMLYRRDANGAGQTRVMNLKKILSQKKLEEAALVQSGDVIYVPQGKLSKIERIAHLGQFGAIYTPIR